MMDVAKTLLLTQKSRGLVLLCLFPYDGFPALSGSWRTGFVLGDIGLKANSANPNMPFGSLKPKKALRRTACAGGLSV